MAFLNFCSYDLFSDFLAFAIFLILFLVSKTLENFSLENRDLIDYCEHLPKFLYEYYKNLQENKILSEEELNNIELLDLEMETATYPKSYFLFLLGKVRFWIKNLFFQLKK